MADNRSSFSATLMRQRLVVYALLMREMRNRYGKYYLGYLWAFLEPIWQISLLTLVHAALTKSSTIYGEAPVVFFFFGVLPWLMFQNTYIRSIGAFNSNKALYSYRTVKPIDTWLAKILYSFCMYSLLYMLYWLAGKWVGIPFRIEFPLEMMVVFFMLHLLGSALGLLVESAGALYEDVRKLGRMMVRPLFWTSGLFFTIDMIPGSAKPFLLWNPILHATDLIRGLAMPGYTPQGSIAYLGAWVIGMLSFSLIYYRRHRKEIIAI